MKRKQSRVTTLILLILLIGLTAAGYILLKDMKGPLVTLEPKLSDRVGPKQEINVQLSDPSGVRSITVTIKRSGQSMTLLQQDFTPVQPQAAVKFTLEEAKLPEGAFSLEIKAYDGSYAGFGRGNSTTLELPLRLDTQPPRISVKTLPPNIRRGGAASIVYTVSEETSTSGVMVGELFFSGHKQANGSYICLFPFPYALEPANFSPQITATDLAGNVTRSRLLVNAQNRIFKEDTLNIGDSFLNFKADELANLCPEKSTPLDQYICVNNVERVKNDQYLLTVGAKSNDKQLWSGAFQKLPSSAVKANFGDKRTYKYTGPVIDHQVHTGLDLASVAQAKVPAANHGIVVHASPLGIYGGLVIIDHGLGLFTLYSHLSSIAVQPGDEVKSGQLIGHTGTTGLAGGDHVHFGFLIGGVPVQPLEWLDNNWIKNNITSRIGQNS